MTCPKNVIIFMERRRAMADTEISRTPIPNEETREAIRQARAGEGLNTYVGVEELIAELDDA